MNIEGSFDFEGDLHISQDEVHLKSRARAPIAHVQFRITLGLIRFELHEHIIFNCSQSWLHCGAIFCYKWKNGRYGLGWFPINPILSSPTSGKLYPSSPESRRNFKPNSRREKEMKRLFFVSIMCIGILMAGPALCSYAWAQDIDLAVENPAETEAVGQTAVSVGLGAGIAPDYEGSSDYRAVPIPFVSVRFSNDMNILWIANLVRANLIPSRTWMGGPIIQYIQKRDDVDNNKVDKLDSVDASLMTGGFFGVRIDQFSLSIEAMQDIADGNEGAIVRLRGGYHIPISKEWSASLNAFTTWADEDYIEAYFGINQRNANKSGLKTFDADEGFKDVGIALPVTYSPWEDWSILGAVAYKRLLGDAADSPVVDDEGDANQFVGGMVLIYRF
jgi:outer membrane protein